MIPNLTKDSEQDNADDGIHSEWIRWSVATDSAIVNSIGICNLGQSIVGRNES